ncbi:hypothetical protein Aple_015810 [Acrocarpospora pleiomorpha]|uniref:Diol/glycerol dehydratase large subunit domain-containing protein n=1 Tax=Acrocarpospora pleiomorpha TaxID=90975 RepID=A0A5M3XDG2_9ACTN|nr:propanediol/glycerol family dehydratase large subunit [Acrocarpospora pleiomorpha]GES18686.1 hypothetical protein Aple_015810 [Acrocarpospora pleiomorpha]
MGGGLGLRTASAAEIGALRDRAAQAVQAVYGRFGLADFTHEQVKSAVDAAGSKDLTASDAVAILHAAWTIRETGLTMADVMTALCRAGGQDQRHRRPRAHLPDRRPPVRFRHRDRPASQGHRAHPPGATCPELYSIAVH